MFKKRGGPLMAYNVPSTQELSDRNLANIERQLNEHTPPADKAFNRTWAVTEGMAEKELYAFAADRAAANLAMTAMGADLESIGQEYGLVRYPATPWQGTAQYALADGKTLPLSVAFIGPQGLKYTTMASATAPQGLPGSGAIVRFSCDIDGPSGNLSAGDTLTIQSPIEGFPRTCVITATTRLGVPLEDLEEYRTRVLDVERQEGGGGNSSDYRIWAQAVTGVARAYPFSGPPIGSLLTELPGQRTVYVETTPEVNEDGLAPQSLLDLVRAAILADPDTAEAREILGLPADLLYVRSIVRTGIYVSVAGITITTGSMGNAQSQIETAISTLLRSFAPFVQGLDVDFERRDELVAAVLSREAQNVLDNFGGTVENVFFGLSPGNVMWRYPLQLNEKLKLAGIMFTETIT
jgi:uncharacterized phage protein gp47/JayE